MIVGTAGHIDHGKTALVRALTGVDADRLPEEKRRGITIELGHAAMPGPDGRMIAFVDVPGHEKLVRTMVAGAGGIDFALLLVAADDGVMPQTVEHATILSLLGIADGIALVTKVDRVSPEQVAERMSQVRALLAAQGLDGYDAMPVSALRGDGIDALKARLRTAAAAPCHRGVEGEGFRMALDRVFTLEGVGTVVAGSVAAGEVRIGDSLCLAHEPSAVFRVRSLHSHGSSVARATAGERCAVGLAGLERTRVERGLTLCDPAIAAGTARCDVWLRVAATERGPLRSGTRVHLHCGATDLTASVAVLGQAAIAPGESAAAQLVLERPAHLWHGDRVVLRDASARRTIAGGSVLDAVAPARHRQTGERLALLQAQRDEDPAMRLAGVLAHSPHGVDGADWLRGNGLLRWPFDPEALPGVVRAPGGPWMIDDRHLEAIERAVLAVLAAHHARFPDDLGPDTGRVRRMAAPRMPEALWTHLVDRLAAGGKAVRRVGFLHLPAHGEQLREADRVVAQRALPLLLDGRFDPPWVRDIARSTRLPEAQVRGVLARLAKTGEVFQVVKDLYYHPRVVDELAQLARAIVERDGEVTAASYRDATGLGRKRAIQILEFLDRIGFLRRVGDVHLLRPGTALFPAGARSA